MSKIVKRTTNREVKDLIVWLSGSNRARSSFTRSPFEDIDLANVGIPRASVDNLASRLGISKKTMAEDILSISIKTLERKAPAERLDKKTSSHAIQIARVVQHAYEVFEEEQKVRNWMNKPNRALQGTKPLELLETLSGINLVNDILGRIEEGIYS